MSATAPCTIFRSKGASSRAASRTGPLDLIGRVPRPTSVRLGAPGPVPARVQHQPGALTPVCRCTASRVGSTPGRCRPVRPGSRPPRRRPHGSPQRPCRRPSPAAMSRPCDIISGYFAFPAPGAATSQTSGPHHRRRLAGGFRRYRRFRRARSAGRARQGSSASGTAVAAESVLTVAPRVTWYQHALRLAHDRGGTAGSHRTTSSLAGPLPARAAVSVPDRAPAGSGSAPFASPRPGLRPRRTVPSGTAACPSGRVRRPL